MPVAHTLIKVAASEHAKTIAFYAAALKPLGYEKLVSMANGFVGFGVKVSEWFVAPNEAGTESKIHVAFAAQGE